MIDRTQIRLSYLIQLISIGSLSLVHILLPRLIGLESYAHLSAFYAILGFGCLVLNEPISIAILSRVGRGRGVLRSKVTYAAALCVLHAFLGFVLTLLLGLALYRFSLYSDGDLALLFLALLASNISVAFHVCGVAQLVALRRNEVVVICGLLQGLASLGLPIILHWSSVDVIYSVPLAYTASLPVILCALNPRLRVRAILFALKRARRFDIIQVAANSTASTLRLAIINLPILSLSVSSGAMHVAAYRVALAIIFGIYGLVPLHKLTLQRVSSGKVFQNAGTLSVVVATLLAIVSIDGVNWILPTILGDSPPKDLYGVIRWMSPLVILMALIEFRFIHLIRERKYKLNAAGGLLGLVIGVLTALLAGVPQVIGFVIGLAYIAISCLGQKRGDNDLPIELGVVGVALSLFASTLTSPISLAIIAGIYIGIVWLRVRRLN